MSKRKWLTLATGVLLSLILISSQMLIGCAGTPTPNAAPAKTQAAPSTTSAPTTTAAPAATSAPSTTAAPSATAADAGASAADFYKGKTVKIVIPSDPGGTVDTLTRIAVTYLPTVTGATWIVVNEPAGGGLVCINNFYNSTKADGLTLYSSSLGKFVPPILMSEPEAKYDITKLEYVAGLRLAQSVLGMNPKGTYTTLDSLKAAKGLLFASQAPTSLLNLATLLCIDALKLDAKVIAGYQGTADIQMSVLQKETHGSVRSGEAVFQAEKDGWLKAIFQVGAIRDVNYPNWPCLAEITTLTEQQKVAMGALIPDGKAWALPPGVPADRKQFLIDSFKKVFDSKPFQTQATQIAGVWLGTYSPQELSALVQAAFASKAQMPYYQDLVKKYVK